MVIPSQVAPDALLEYVEEQKAQLARREMEVVEREVDVANREVALVLRELEMKNIEIAFAAKMIAAYEELSAEKRDHLKKMSDRLALLESLSASDEGVTDSAASSMEEGR